MPFHIITAAEKHTVYAVEVCQMIAEAAKVRGTGIATRAPAYIQQKIEAGEAIIALDGEKLIGFCYIESWENQQYVVNSGLIVHPAYRKSGLAKAIKKAIFDLSQEKYPKAKLFGITTSLAVMKINSELGYQPVTFSELTQDETFWKGCQSCVNYDILQRNQQKMCLCTAMICTPQKKQSVKSKAKRWEAFSRFLKLRRIKLQRQLKQISSTSKKISL
ncbi:MAG: GNAT family N-acetyltransferase [Thermonemataceae bacterium]